jgi:hypothetical protein
MPPVLYKVTSDYFLSKPVKASQMALRRVLFGTVLREFLLKAGERGNRRSRGQNIFRGTAFARVKLGGERWEKVKAVTLVML